MKKQMIIEMQNYSHHSDTGILYIILRGHWCDIIFLTVHILRKKVMIQRIN